MLFSLGYELWWSRLSNNAEFCKTSFYWWDSGESGRSAVGLTISVQQFSLQFSARKHCAPIFITSSNPGCSGCDHHSNWSIFSHLSSPGSKECLRPKLLCTNLKDKVRVALTSTFFFFKRDQFKKIFNSECNNCMAGKVTLQ